jgi:hypothetical protein
LYSCYVNKRYKKNINQKNLALQESPIADISHVASHSHRRSSHGVTYAWTMTYVGSAGQQASVALYKENVRFVNGATTQIVMGSSGTGDTPIVRLYLGAPSNNLTDITANTDISSGKALSSRSTVTISVTLPNGGANDWITGETCYFKVVPNQGQAFPFQARAPQ